MTRQTHPYEMARRRKALISVIKDGGLPSEYQRVEYIENVGKQYINTGISLESDMEITVTYEFGTQFGWRRLFGWGSAGENSSYSYCFKTDKSTNAPRVATGSGNETILPSYTTGKYTVVLDTSGYISVYGGSDYNQSREIPAWTPSAGNHYIYLFNFGGTTLRDYGLARVYEFVVRNAANKCIASLVPCYRKSDNKPGMFDTVSKQFLTNQGTGEFVLGPEV